MPDTAPSIVREATVTLLASHAVSLPSHLPWRSVGEASGAERLVELVARVRNQSLSNPADRPTSEFVQQLVAIGDDALAHAHVVVLVEGVSQQAMDAAARAAVGLHVTSTPARLMDAATVRFVVPVDMRGDAMQESRWLSAMTSAWSHYLACGEAMMDRFTWMDNKVLRRRRALEAATSLLPAGVEAPRVMSGNVVDVRASLLRWGDEDRELEVRALAIAMWRALNSAMPALFGDLTAYIAADRHDALRSRAGGF